MSNKYNIAFIKIYEYMQLHPTLIYIAVGSATNVLCNDNGILKINPGHDQQYPIFLQEFKKHNLDVPVIIVLIDERLHTDPFIVKSRYIKDISGQYENKTDICFNDNSALLDKGWKLKSEIDTMKVYENKYTNIIVFAIKDNVDYKYCSYVSANNEDITNFNSDIATAAINSGGCFVFNDYSGRDFSKYVEYMNNEYYYYLDRVVFGLGFGDYNGCFPELVEPHYIVQFAYTGNKIKTFNPYRYILDSTLSLYNEKLPTEFSINIARSQLGRCIHHMTNSAYDTLFPVYRNIILINKCETVYNEHIHIYFNKAQEIYGNFDFTIDSITHLIKIQLTEILKYVGSESKCDDLMNLLMNKNMYDGIQQIKDTMRLIIDDFVKKRWV
jgi:hypothetical protein